MLGIDSPHAWIAVAGGILPSFVAFGVTYAFGVFVQPIGMLSNGISNPPAHP
jgi:hypothetical protein